MKQNGDLNSFEIEALRQLEWNGSSGMQPFEVPRVGFKTLVRMAFVGYVTQRNPKTDLPTGGFRWWITDKGRGQLKRQTGSAAGAANAKEGE